ncbi:hypothetical protein [Prevotella sp.]
MINLYDFITDNLLDNITSSNEQVALLYLVRKSKEKGEISPNVQVQKTHIARICHYCTSDRSNMTKFANHIEEQLKEHGYISTTYESWLTLGNGKKIRTTTWVFTDNFHENLQNAKAQCKLKKSTKKKKPYLHLLQQRQKKQLQKQMIIKITHLYKCITTFRDGIKIIRCGSSHRKIGRTANKYLWNWQ